MLFNKSVTWVPQQLYQIKQHLRISRIVDSEALIHSFVSGYWIVEEELVGVWLNNPSFNEDRPPIFVPYDAGSWMTRYWAV